MDKLKAFESFVSVATRGSLTAAAKAEGVAPAIMGRRLHALEEQNKKIGLATLCIGGGQGCATIVERL